MNMFEILDFARCHERKIYETKTKPLDNKGALQALQKLVIGEYLRRIEKKGVPPFYTVTSKGLNLFGDLRNDQPITEEVKADVIKTLEKASDELEIKPWEVKFHIIHVIGREKIVTAQNILDYFSEYFPGIKGSSKPNIYRNIKHLRMKGYIKYEKMTQIGQSEYKLSKKGEEIFNMTQTDATRKLRTSEEWDRALVSVFQKVDQERKEDDEALYNALVTYLPDLDGVQLIWVLYTQGYIYELKGALDRAEEVYLRMEGICEDAKDSKGRAYALKGLGNVAFKRGKYSVAKQYYKRCHKGAEELQYTELLSDVVNNLGSCLYMEDEIDESLSLFEEALRLAGTDKSRQASALYNKGLCYARMEDLVTARKFWVQSLNLYEELEEKIEIRKVKHNLREIDKKQKREYLEEKYRKQLQTGTSKDAEKAYKDLAAFIFTMDNPRNAQGENL